MIKNNTRRGVTLIEVLFVLGIASIVIGLVMLLVSQAGDRKKANQLKSEILQIVNIANSLSDGESDYQNVSGTDIIKSGLLPASYSKNGMLITPYGSEINVFVYGPGNKDDTGRLAVYLSGVPKVACVELITQDFSGLATAVNGNWNWGGGVTNTGVKPNNVGNVCMQNNNWIGINFPKQ